MTEPHFMPVAMTADIPPGTIRAVEAGGLSILICNSDGRFLAVENLCSHAYQPLECGRMRHGWIACPAHGARFDLETGEVLGGPATVPIATFAVRVIDGWVEVAI